MKKLETLKELREFANMLHMYQDTEWAEEHQYLYDGFENAIEKAYQEKKISAKEHDDLALKAFYDYFNIYYY